MTKETAPRRLVFFVCDDNRLLESDRQLVEIWRPVDAPPRSNIASVSGWLEHCQQAFRHKQIAFDALSIDVFFAKDGSDPAKALKGGAGSTFAGNICSGLYHGLAAMARRRTHTDDGNAMPLAWEVRTASPDMHLTPEQEVEIVRIYGLLLAITEPYNSEGGFLGLERTDDPMTWPSDLVLRAFREQEARPGAALDIAKSLLPQWRARFAASVRAQDVRIRMSALQACVKAMDGRRLAPDFDPSAIFDGPDAVVPILDRRNRVSEKILLSSIFADLDEITPADWSIVRAWLVGLTATQKVDLTDSLESARQWLLAAKACFDRTEDETLAERRRWEMLEKSQQCLILVAYYVAATLDGRRFRFPPSQDDFLAAVGIKKINGHTAPRIFEKASEHVGIEGLADLKAVVLGRLGDRDLQLPFSENFCQALGILLSELGLRAEVETGFPALQPFLPPAAGGSNRRVGSAA